MKPLKEATAEKHKTAERMPFNVKMFKGQLSKRDYHLYLVQQLEIFKSIEEKGTPHPSLNRMARVEEDIRELQTPDLHAAPVLDGTAAYANYLRSLSYEHCLPHVYLNYLALMYGGQLMKKAVPSTGKMYEFENKEEALLSVRNVQKDEWADEVNRGFDFMIQIFEDLNKAAVAV